MILALLVYLLITVVFLLLEARLLRHTAAVPMTYWLTRHAYIPMLRTVAVFVFIAVAYPESYGLSQVPPFLELLAGDDGRLDFALNITLLVMLLLPLLPHAASIPAVILTAQGLVAAAIVAAWIGRSLGMTNLDYWPGSGAAAAIVVAVVVGWGVGRLLTKWLHRDPTQEAVLTEAARMAAQLPAVLIYARALGAQFHP